MGAGIEHRSGDTVLQAYSDYACPNFAVFNGKRICVKHDSGNIDQAYQELQGFLNLIQASNTGAVYTLYVFPESVKNINAGTPFSQATGSTTFMLQPLQPGGVGNTVIMPNNNTGMTRTDPALNAKVAELEREKEILLHRLHKQELEDMRKDFSNQIAGIQLQNQNKHWTDRLMDVLEAKPEMIKETLSGIGKLINSIIRKPVDYTSGYTSTVIPGGGQMSGTANNTDMNNSETVEVTDEGALINPFLTAEQRALDNDEQQQLLIIALKDLNQEQHDDVQSECLEMIEKRIGAATLSRLLISVASMNKKSLNKLLSHLDS